MEASPTVARSIDESINKREIYDINAAHWLLSQVGKITKEEKRIIRGIVRNSSNVNEHNCVYKLGKKSNFTSPSDSEFIYVGRWIADRGVGLQSLDSNIRALLAKNYYFDIDIVNAHPNILLKMCVDRGWSCKYNTILCEKREELFAKWEKINPMHTRAFCKIEILRMMFGGKPNANTPAWIEKYYYPELRKIMLNIANENEPMYTKQKKMKPHNPEGSVAALILQTEERKCLMALESYLQQQGRQFDVLIHDGGFVRRKDGEKNFPEKLLREAEKFIFNKTGYPLKLLQKNLETNITVPDSPQLDPNRSYEAIKVEFEKTRFKCKRNIRFYEINDEYITCKKRTDFMDTYENLKFQESDKNGFIIDTKFVPRWLEDPNMRQYEDMRIFLPPEMPRENQYNLWDGFRIQGEIYTDEHSIVGRDILLDHIRHVVGDECFNYVIKWIALLFQRPSTKPNVCILIKSDQGLGKGLFFEILQSMIGKKYCYITEHTNHVVGQFNILLKDKLLVALDENDRLTGPATGIVKGLITNSNLTITKKNVDPVEHPNLTHILVFSNKSWPWKLEESDRRTLAIDRTRIPKLGANHYNAVGTALGDDFALKELYDYFMGIDVTNYDPERDRPHTEFVDELKQYSRPIELEYFIHVIVSHTVSFSVTAKCLWDGFRDYLFSNLSDAMARKYESSSVKLALSLRSYKIDGMTPSRQKSGMTYVFDYEKTHKWLENNRYI